MESVPITGLEIGVLRFAFCFCRLPKLPNIAAAHDMNTLGDKLIIGMQARIAFCFCFCCLPNCQLLLLFTTWIPLVIADSWQTGTHMYDTPGVILSSITSPHLNLRCVNFSSYVYTPVTSYYDLYSNSCQAGPVGRYGDQARSVLATEICNPVIAM